MSTTISRQSAEVLNETRGIEDSIMLALTLNENMGDQDPSIGWRPGDPLFDYPRGTWDGDLWDGGQYVRPMFELMADGDFHVPRLLLLLDMNTCDACDVMWHYEEGTTCWVCGEGATRSAYAARERPVLRTPRPPAREDDFAEVDAASGIFLSYAAMDAQLSVFSAAISSSRSIVDHMYGPVVFSGWMDELRDFAFSFSERDVEPYVPPTPTSLFQMAKDVDVELDVHRRYALVCRRTVTGEVMEQRFENVVGAAEICLQKPVPVTDVLDRLRTSSGPGWRGIDCQNGGNRGPEVAGRSLWGN